MNLYLITRAECACDEHDAAIVAAASESDALTVAKDELYPHGDIWDTATIRMIGTTETETRVVLSSFNAG